MESPGSIQEKHRGVNALLSRVLCRARRAAHNLCAGHDVQPGEADERCNAAHCSRRRAHEKDLLSRGGMACKHGRAGDTAALISQGYSV